MINGDDKWWYAGADVHTQRDCINENQKRVKVDSITHTTSSPGRAPIEFDRSLFQVNHNNQNATEVVHPEDFLWPDNCRSLQNTFHRD